MNEHPVLHYLQKIIDGIEAGTVDVADWEYSQLPFMNCRSGYVEGTVKIAFIDHNQPIPTEYRMRAGVTE